MIKPILFNTDMVRAIQADRKTVTRRAVKPQPPVKTDDVFVYRIEDGAARFGWKYDNALCDRKLPYHPGDILYVRETWRIWKAHRYDADAHIEFKAGGEGIVLRFPHGCTDSANRDDYDSFVGKWGVCSKWRPSIHMPREAARIFLRVTDVRVERLQEITEKQARAEGVVPFEITVDVEQPEREREWFECASALPVFPILWDSTIKSADRARYGWDANPWVWVIEFERISREEAKRD